MYPLPAGLVPLHAPNDQVKSRTQFSYDGRDRIASIVNARGNKIEYGYETWGPVNAERQYPTTTATTPSRIISYTFDNDANVLTVSDSDVPATPAYSMTYDALSRLYDETIRYIPGGNRSLQHRYDRYGNRGGLTLVDGASIAYNYSYNKLNQLASATLAGAAVTVTYFANDDRQMVTLPNAVTEQFIYQPNGPVQRISVDGPSGQIAQLAYTYDDVLNVDTQTDSYGSHNFDYDGLNRLTQTARPVSAGLSNESYLYDRVGNREDPSNAALYGYDNNNRIAASPSLTYAFDADGNMLSRSDGVTLVHDARNKLRQYATGSITANYLYDAVGRRIRKSVNGDDVWMLWDGANLLGEFNAAGTRLKRYAYLDGSYAPVQLQDANGTYYVHSDHAQAPRLVTNATAQTEWRSRHHAFGGALVEADVDGDGISLQFNRRLPGQDYDPESGLVYNYYRNFDPATGRYVQSDPLGHLGGINTYAYAANNPLMVIDPYGLYCLKMNEINGIAGAVSGAFSGAISLAGAGPAAMAVGLALGGVYGGMIGYFGTETTLGQAALLGGAAGGGTSLNNPIKGVASGAIGAIVGAELGGAGVPSSVAGPVGGAVGGFVGNFAAVMGSSQGPKSMSKSLLAAMRSGRLGGLAGLSGAALGAALTELLIAGNECTDCEK